MADRGAKGFTNVDNMLRATKVILSVRERFRRQLATYMTNM